MLTICFLVLRSIVVAVAGSTFLHTLLLTHFVGPRSSTLGPRATQSLQTLGCVTVIAPVLELTGLVPTAYTCYHFCGYLQLHPPCTSYYKHLLLHRLLTPLSVPCNAAMACCCCIRCGCCECRCHCYCQCCCSYLCFCHGGCAYHPAVPHNLQVSSNLH